MSHNPVIVVRQPGAPAIVTKPVQVQAEVVSPGLQGPQGEPGAGGLTNYQLLAIAPNQTAFNLSAIPSAPHLSQLYLNGQKATYGTHYTINSAVLNWLSDTKLEPSDSLEIYY